MTMFIASPSGVTTVDQARWRRDAADRRFWVIQGHWHGHRQRRATKRLYPATPKESRASARRDWLYWFKPLSGASYLRRIDFLTYGQEVTDAGELAAVAMMMMPSSRKDQ